MSVQKLRCWPSATMISRPPSRTTRAFAVRSLWGLVIISASLEGISPPVPSCHNQRNFRAIFRKSKGVFRHGEYTRTDPAPGVNPVVAPDADDGWNARGQGKAQ